MESNYRDGPVGHKNRSLLHSNTIQIDIFRLPVL